MPTPLDPCTNTATTIGQLGQMLCFLSDALNDLHTDLDNFISTSNSSFGALETNTDDAITKLDGLRDTLGYVGEPDTVRENLVNLISTQASQDTALGSLQDTIGTKDPTASNIISCVWNPTDLTSVYFQSKFARENTEHAGQPLGNLIGVFLANIFGGGNEYVALAQLISSIWNAPPLDVLHASTAVALAATNTIAIASGVYGYTLSLTVPSYWGQLSSNPLVYQPFIGVASFSGTFGTVGDVVKLAAPTAQIYPIPVGASQLHITLEPGISGTYKELRFAG